MSRKNHSSKRNNKRKASTTNSQEAQASRALFEAMEPRLLLSAPTISSWINEGIGGTGTTFRSSLSNDGTGMFVSNDMGSPYYSGNSGTNWTNITSSGQTCVYNKSETFFTADTNRAWMVLDAHSNDVGWDMYAPYTGTRANPSSPWTWTKAATAPDNGYYLHSMAASPNVGQEKMLVVSTAGGKLCFAPDGTATPVVWQTITTGTREPFIAGAYFDSNGQDIYVAADTRIGSDGADIWHGNLSGGVWTWTRMNFNLPAGERIYQFAGARQGATVRFIISTTATSFNLGPNSNYPLFTTPTNYGDAYNYDPNMATWGYRGIYTLDNAAGSWQQKLHRPATPAGTDEMNVLVGMAVNDISTMYVGGMQWMTSQLADAPLVRKSTDGGATWSTKIGTGESLGIFASSGNANIQTGWHGNFNTGTFADWTWTPIATLTVAPLDSSKVLTGDDAIFYSSDSGSNWKCVSVTSDSLNAAGTPADPHRVPGYQGTFEENSTWGVTWVDANNVIASTTDIGPLFSTDGGKHWSLPRFNDTGITTVNTFYNTVVGANGVVYGAGSGAHDLWVDPTKFFDYTSQTDPSTGIQNGVFYSTDNGASWTKLHTWGLTAPVRQVVLDPDDPLNTLYALVVNYTGDFGGIYVTHNLQAGTGATWTELASPAQTQGHPFGLTVLPSTQSSPERLIATYGPRRDSWAGGLIGEASSPTQINLQWPRDSWDQTEYKIQISTNSDFSGATTYTVTDPGTTRYTITGLTANTKYYIQIWATNSAGNSVVTPLNHYNGVDGNGVDLPKEYIITPTTITVAPTSPTGFTAVSASSATTTAVNMRWEMGQPTTLPGYTQTGFRLERWYSGALNATFNLSASARSYIDTTATAGNTYTYKLYAVNSAGDSTLANTSVAVSLTAAANPAAPLMFEAINAGRDAISTRLTVNLIWNSGSAEDPTNVTDINSYTIERSTTSNFASYTVIATLDGNTHSYSDADPSLADGTTYYYRIKATNAHGTSSYSLLAKAVATNTSGVNLGIPAKLYPLANGGEVYSSGVFLSTDGGATWDNRTANGTAGTHNQSVGDGWADNTVFLRQNTTPVVVDPMDPTGNTWYACERFTDTYPTGTLLQTNGVYKTTDAGLTWFKLFAPVVDPPNHNPFSVVISPATNEMLVSDDYGVFYSSNANATRPTFTNTGMPCGSSPTFFNLNPYNPNNVWMATYGNGFWDTTWGTPTGPAAPTLSIPIVGNPPAPQINNDATSDPAAPLGSYHLTWNSVSGATGYTVRYSTANSRDVSGLIVWTNMATLGSGTTTYDTPGLNPKSAYIFEVLANNASGSTPSNCVKAYTLTPPTNLAVQPLGGGDFKITWNNTAPIALSGTVSGPSTYGVQLQFSTDGVNWTDLKKVLLSDSDGVQIASAQVSVVDNAAMLSNTQLYFRAKSLHKSSDTYGMDSPFSYAVATRSDGSASAGTDKLLAYEPFDGYKPASYLDNSYNQGGYGWAATDPKWTCVQNWNELVAAGNVSYSGGGDNLLGLGNKFEYLAHYEPAYRNMPVSIGPGQPDTTIYASAVIHVAADSTCNNPLVLVGRADNNNWLWFGAKNGYWSVGNMRSGVDAWSSQSALAVANNQDIFVVYSIDYVNRVVKLWVNPTQLNTSTPPASPTLTYTYPTGSVNDPVVGSQMGMYGWGAPHYFLDELRAGTTYASVTPIVAPSAAPTVLTATAVAGSGSQTINLSWQDNASNETGYKIEWSNNAFSTVTGSTTVAAGVTTCSVPSLAAGSVWSFRVAATNAGGVNSSAYSNIASERLYNAGTAPTAPSGLTSPAGGLYPDKVVLNWTDNSSDETGFRIQVKDVTLGQGSWTTIATTSAYSGTGSRTCTVTNLTPGHQYDFQIAATKTTGGDSSFATSTWGGAILKTAAPAAVTGLAAPAYDSSSVTLTWTATPAQNEDGFRVSYSTDNYNWFLFTTTAANATGTTVTGLAANTRYFFRVDSVNNAGATFSSVLTQSTAAANLPTAPSGLGATAASSSQINLAWTDNASNETGFKVYQSTDGTNFNLIQTINTANTTSSNVTGLSASTQYWFKVTAFNAGGESSYSNTANATTQSSSSGLIDPLTVGVADSSGYYTGWPQCNPVNMVHGEGFFGGSAAGAPVVPTNNDHQWMDVFHTTTAFVVLDLGSVQTIAALDIWNFNINGWTDAGLKNVVISYSADSTYAGATFTTLTSMTLTQADNSVNNTEHDHIVVANVGMRFIKIQSSTNYGNAVYSGLGAVEVFAPSAPVAPSAPSGLGATVASASQINLTWTDNASNETGFKVYQSTDGTTYNLIQTINTPNTQSYNVGSLTANTHYWYKVTAFNAGGESSYSNAVNTYTLSNVPTSLTATTASQTQINLSWTETGTAATYNVYRSTDGVNFGTAIATGIATTSYNNTSLTADTQYWYKVTAVNGGGAESAQSTAANNWTLSNVPTSLTATPASSSQINLTWSESGAASSYKIYRAPDVSGAPGTFAYVNTSASPSFNDTGLAANTKYWYQVTAVNGGAAESGYSNQTSATTFSVATLDGFGGYTIGALVGQGTAGNGWAGAWARTYSPNATVVAGDLTPSVGLAMTGNAHANLGTVGGIVTRNTSSSLSSIGTTVWVSAVIKTNWNAASQWGAFTVGNVNFQYHDRTGNNDMEWTINGVDGTWYGTSWGTGNAPASNNTTYFVVIKMTYNAGNDSVRVWLNPAPGATDPSDASSFDYKSSVNAGGSLTAVQFSQTWYNSTEFDEVRLGTTYASVAPTGTLLAPSAPSGLTAAAALTNQVNLTWTDNSSNETGFYVDRATDSGFTQNLVTNSVAANVTAYSSTGLAANTTYYYRVRSYNGGGSSANTSTVSAATMNTAAMPTALKALWRFDEGSGTTANDTDTDGVSDTGTLNGTPTWATAKVGKGLTLNGTSQYIQASNSTDLNISGTGFSTAMWVKSGATNWNSTQTFISKGNQYKFGGVSGGKNIQFSLYIGGWKNLTYTNSGDISTSWHHYAATYDGSNMRIWVDGTNVATMAQSGSIGTDTNVCYIGRIASTYLSGSIDEVRVYNAALVQADVTALNNQANLSVTGLTTTNGHTASYSVQASNLAASGSQYGDQTFNFTAVPSKYLGSTWIKTAQADNTSTASNLMSFTVNQPVILYVAFDDAITSKPAWLTSQFTDSGDDITTAKGTFSIYKLAVSAGTIILGGPGGTGSQGMYNVFFQNVL